ncbi:hypothetical protein F885_03018 [Acinetobacter higginsii]|uniref:hypothetical protein n=1 Tax=Acinetobacter higginsii TaxID=70347 RepID=UPI0002CDDD6E|nr:hypothetical protein [Acinetobacter higginsii]ENX56862.1 hypothetical protein F885_03018 [Acinetobacter higginsii]
MQIFGCSQFSQPDANGIQQCMEWVVVSTSILPPLTIEEATVMGGGFWLICVVAKGYRELADFIKTLR